MLKSIHSLYQNASDGSQIEALTGVFQLNQHFFQLFPGQMILFSPHDFRMFRAGHRLADQQLLRFRQRRAGARAPA